MYSKVINGNALHIPLADESVQCCITSPPYWGLRDYGTAFWEGGSPECDHKQSTARNDGGRVNTNGFHGSVATDSDKGMMNYRDVCGKCGAIRVDNQIGIEATPEAYVTNIVAVFREVGRVLRKDGVVFLNLGDSYYGSAMTGGNNGINAQGTHKKERQFKKSLGIERANPYGLKPKDIVGIPWRVAFALQADGWYLRQDIIWHKPNPMPESVKDRCTKSHEYIFLLSKSAQYYYDAEAIRERAAYDGRKDTVMKGRDKYKNGFVPGQAEQTLHARGHERWQVGDDGEMIRNKRSVWTVPTKPYKGAHFATFPPDLVEPMILASSATGDIVFDPFAGTATVGQVCVKHNRNFIGLELNPEYIELAKNRMSNVQIMLTGT